MQDDAHGISLSHSASGMQPIGAAPGREASPDGEAHPDGEAPLQASGTQHEACAPWAPELTPVHAIGRHEPPIAFYTDLQDPVNKDKWRYAPCILDEKRQIYVEADLAPEEGRLSWIDRGPDILLSQDASYATCNTSWQSVRYNCPLREGVWYWEVDILRSGGLGCDKAVSTEEAAGAQEASTSGDLEASTSGGSGASTSGSAHSSFVRLGISRRESSLMKPVGADRYSFAIRDTMGEKRTDARGSPYGRPLRPGDTVGVKLVLPRQKAHRIARWRVPILLKNKVFFEYRDMEPWDKHEPPLQGSSLEFYINGEAQGTAFADLPDFVPHAAPEDAARKRPAKRKAAAGDPGAEEGAVDPLTGRERLAHDDGFLGYFPTISLFQGGMVRMNAGPHFRHACPAGARPLAERYPEYALERTYMDLVEAHIVDGDPRHPLAPLVLPVSLWIPYAQEGRRRRRLNEVNSERPVKAEDGLSSETAKTEAAKTETAKTETVETENGLSNETVKTETVETETANAETAKTENGLSSETVKTENGLSSEAPVE